MKLFTFEQYNQMVEKITGGAGDAIGGGAVNVYVCDKCKAKLVTVKTASGTTPMFMNCQHACGGVLRSMLMSADIVQEPPTHEFYRPTYTQYVTLHQAERQHVENGGLLVRVVGVLNAPNAPDDATPAPAAETPPAVTPLPNGMEKYSGFESFLTKFFEDAREQVLLELKKQNIGAHRKGAFGCGNEANSAVTKTQVVAQITVQPFNAMLHSFLEKYETFEKVWLPHFVEKYNEAATSVAPALNELIDYAVGVEPAPSFYAARRMFRIMNTNQVIFFMAAIFTPEATKWKGSLMPLWDSHNELTDTLNQAPNAHNN